jgi:hypothetical protein
MNKLYNEIKEYKKEQNVEIVQAEQSGEIKRLKHQVD